jgi:hypothetical protein
MWNATFRTRVCEDRPEDCGMPKSFSKNVRLSPGVVGKTVFLFCCANLRPAGEGLWLAGSPNSAGLKLQATFLSSGLNLCG